MSANRSVLVIIGNIIACFVLAGCPATRGYSGPELPDEQIAMIRFDANPLNVSINRRVVDTIETNAWGIDMLPGYHDYLLDISAKGPYSNCLPYKTIDFSGLNKCLQNNRYCDCFEYLTVYKRCAFPLTLFTCEGDFQSRAGSRYDIEVDNGLGGFVSRVQESESNTRLGERTCTVTGSSSGQENVYVGSGRVTATANGIFLCP